MFFKRENFWLPDNKGERRVCLEIHAEIGFDEGLLKKLATNAETGIIGDDTDLKRRRRFYGRNKKARPSIRSCGEILWSQFEDPLVQCLIILSCLWLVASIWSTVKYSSLEGAAIIFAVLFAAIVQTMTDYSKEYKFLQLAKEIDKEKCKVLRG